MLPLAEALAAYARELQPLPVVNLPLQQALHRVLRQPLHAKTDLPRHSQSALDGYVLTTEDAAAAPISLRIADSIAAGDTRTLRPLVRGQVQRILTGARVPPNAGAVVAQERVTVANGHVSISKPLEAGANIRWQGEEKQAGAVLAEAGLRLNAGHIAAAAIGGHAELPVTRAPRIHVLVTGDELREPGSALEDGQIWDSNGPLVLSWLAAQGYHATGERVADTPEATRAALERALHGNDLIITTGGVSVGDRDYILPCAEQLGVRRVFWEVAQKPGKPLYFGIKNKISSPLIPLPQVGERNLPPPPPEGGGRGEGLRTSALLGIPGNPAAVLVCLALHARSLLATLEGGAAPAWQHGVLAQPVKSDAQRDRLVRMHGVCGSDGRVMLSDLPHQDSHMLSNLLTANALAHLPSRPQGYAAGELVRWMALP